MAVSCIFVAFNHCLLTVSAQQMLHELVDTPSPWLAALPDFLALLKTSLMRPVISSRSDLEPCAILRKKMAEDGTSMYLPFISPLIINFTSSDRFELI